MSVVAEQSWQSLLPIELRHIIYRYLSELRETKMQVTSKEIRDEYWASRCEVNIPLLGGAALLPKLKSCVKLSLVDSFHRHWTAARQGNELHNITNHLQLRAKSEPETLLPALKQLSYTSTCATYTSPYLRDGDEHDFMQLFPASHGQIEMFNTRPSARDVFADIVAAVNSSLVHLACPQDSLAVITTTIPSLHTLVVNIQDYKATADFSKVHEIAPNLRCFRVQGTYGAIAQCNGYLNIKAMKHIEEVDFRFVEPSQRPNTDDIVQFVSAAMKLYPTLRDVIWESKHSNQLGSVHLVRKLVESIRQVENDAVRLALLRGYVPHYRSLAQSVLHFCDIEILQLLITTPGFDASQMTPYLVPSLNKLPYNALSLVIRTCWSELINDFGMLDKVVSHTLLLGHPDVFESLQDLELPRSAVLEYGKNWVNYIVQRQHISMWERALEHILSSAPKIPLSPPIFILPHALRSIPMLVALRPHIEHLLPAITDEQAQYNLNYRILGSYYNHTDDTRYRAPPTVRAAAIEKAIGLNLNARDLSGHGGTAFMAHCQYQGYMEPRVFQTNLLIADNDGNTVLHLLAKGKEPFDEPLITCILNQAGVSNAVKLMTSRNKNNQTAMDLFLHDPETEPPTSLFSSWVSKHLRAIDPAVAAAQGITWDSICESLFVAITLSRIDDVPVYLHRLLRRYAVAKPKKRPRSILQHYVESLSNLTSLLPERVNLHLQTLIACGYTRTRSFSLYCSAFQIDNEEIGRAAIQGLWNVGIDFESTEEAYLEHRYAHESYRVLARDLLSPAKRRHQEGDPYDSGDYDSEASDD